MDSISGFEFKVKDPIDSACAGMLVAAGEAGFDVGFETAIKLMINILNK